MKKKKMRSTDGPVAMTADEIEAFNKWRSANGLEDSSAAGASTQEQTGAKKTKKKKLKRKAEAPSEAAAVAEIDPADEPPEFMESSEEEDRPKKKKKKKKKQQEGQPSKPAKQQIANPEPPSEKPRNDLKVWLGNLPWAATEEVIRTDFGKFGEITRIHLPKNTGGFLVGSGYIYYKEKETVEKVLLLDDIEYKGRTINVRRRSPRRRSGKRQSHLRHNKYEDEDEEATPEASAN